MLILSRFRDYYDTASAFGIDKTCVYDRKEEIFKLDKGRWSEPGNILLPDKKKVSLQRRTTSQIIKTDKFYYKFHKQLIGFCGHIYPVIKVEKEIDENLKEIIFFYSEEDLNKYMNKEQIEKRKKRRWSYFGDFDVQTSEGLKGFFNPVDPTSFIEIFHAFRAPSFAVADFLIINPNLSKLGFMKVKDPQTAFQDIYMFLSGVIGAPPKDQKPIDDEVMAASKGHDSPYSFKKPPGKRGKNKWR